MVKLSSKEQKIRNILQDFPDGISYREIMKRSGFSKTTVYETLNPLEELGSAYNSNQKWYPEKPLVESHNIFEFKVALSHSKKLLQYILGEPGEVCLVEPCVALDFMVFNDLMPDILKEFLDRDSMFELIYLRQHLASGYPEIKKKIEEYREKLVKLGGPFREEIILCGPEREEVEQEPDEPDEGTAKDVEKLKSSLLEEIRYLNRLVRHGTPLKGTCDCCPSQHVKGARERLQTPF
jgi:DNA-binding Lrp family transcriptional regulator